jgi:hypothetical protein
MFEMQECRAISRDMYRSYRGKDIVGPKGGQRETAQIEFL